MEHIIGIDEIKALGRPIGKVSTEKLMAYITEAEQLNIKPVLGDELFLKLLDDNEQNDEKVKILLNGGTYRDERDKLHSFLGLKVALSYFVYAQNLMSGDIESTRYGSMMKNGEFSTHISSKERSDAYNNSIDVANAYLKECVVYCKHTGLIKTAGKAQYNVGGITIRKIGR